MNFISNKGSMEHPDSLPYCIRCDGKNMKCQDCYSIICLDCLFNTDLNNQVLYMIHMI